MHVSTVSGAIKTENYDEWGPSNQLKQCTADIKLVRRFGDNAPAVFKVEKTGKIALSNLTAPEKNIEIVTFGDASIEGKICREIHGEVGGDLSVALEDKIEAIQFKNMVVKGKKTLQLLLVQDSSEDVDEL